MDTFLVVFAACMAGSIALCGIPFGLIIARNLNGIDVREAGSGNIGMTNVARTAGASAAALTFACDVGKGLFSMLLARTFLGVTMPEGFSFAVTDPGFAALTVIYACCVLGHVYSPYLGFHGGKGISVGFGAALGLHWPIAICLLVAFLLLALPTRYISAGSIFAAATLPIQVVALWHLTPWSTMPLILVSVVVIYAHRSNIIKLIRGEESRFSVKSSEGTSSRRSRIPPTKRRESEQNEDWR